MSAPFIHAAAICESPRIGARTRLWAFAHVLPEAVIGADCNICDHVFVENDVVVGDRVTVKSGVQLWDGVRLGDDVFVGPNATFTNDRFPRSRQHPEAFAVTTVEAGASIGANATILPGVRIGAGAMVGAGAVVVTDVAPDTVVVGNPARPISECREGIRSQGAQVDDRRQEALAVDDVALIDFSRFTDRRGNLTPLEPGNPLPFEIARAYWIYEVPGGARRGGHAYHRLEEIFVALSGSFDVILDDGSTEQLRSLNRAYVGLYVPPLIWRRLENFSTNAVCLILASRPYEASDYLYSREEYLAARRS